MSGSEDGQLRSPADEHMLSDDDDTDSLDIKPPQANVIRDATGGRRKEKSGKDKKHSKERKHRERLSDGGGGEAKEREKDYNRDGRNERRSDIDRRDVQKREEREPRYHHHQRQSGSYEGDGREFEKRYHAKHYERRSHHIGSAAYHHQESYQQYQHHASVNVRHRQDYYERRQDYHHQPPADYHVQRQHHHVQQHQHTQQSYGGGKHHQDVDVERRTKYNYDHAKDPESLEQDLRSRLLSKRHKYVKDDSIEFYERNNRSYEERGHDQRSTSKSEHHKTRREKVKEQNIIEVFDSPEGEHPRHTQRKKHKRHKEKHEKRASSLEEITSSKLIEAPEKRRAVEDPELMARRAKFLTAEQEKQKRKEIARKELEARREILRERGTAVDALSPTAVAASVTAGLHIIKRKKSDEGEDRTKRKRSKKSKDSDGDEEEEEEEEEEEDEEEEEEENEGDNRHGEDGTASDSSSDDEEDNSVSESATESERSYKRGTVISKKKKDSDESEVDISLPNSPLSIGELSKSPKQKKRDAKRKKKQVFKPHSDEDDEDDDDENKRHGRSSRSHSLTLSLSRSGSRSHSRTAGRSRSRSSHSPNSRSVSSRSHSRSRTSTEHSRSRSIHSLSPSRSPSRSSHSHSRSRSRSRSRSEERDMKENFRREQTAKLNEKRSNELKLETDLPALDDKGKPLPNYYPGIQGCRSVEEFQCLNRIEEGTYGVVYRAKDKRTHEIVALKRLKMEKEKEGFPITSLREINTLLKGQHPNIVTVREIVVGSNMDKIYIVMDYVEHDLKSLMETMKERKQSFLPAEIKCLTQQLLKAVAHLHDNWILHRDLKTSNLLLSHKGILKVGDFGLAREYGSPLKEYTSVVVTLYYRAPELLLCSTEYSTPIDVWSVGCIFAEFLQMAPLFPGKSEVDQLNRIFKLLGTPNEKIWPGYNNLPAVKNMISKNSQFAEYPVSSLRKYLGQRTSDNGVGFLQGLLTYDPRQRFTAESALKHVYFKELPIPIDPSMFPTWPAKSELGARKALASPKPPSGGSQFKQLGKDDLAASGSGGKIISGIITGNKKTSANTGFVLNASVDQRHLAMAPGFKLKF
ncbi:cyclin dependent kinase 11B pitslre isoform 1-T1 [Glossina fuscipes fuscipes]